MNYLGNFFLVLQLPELTVFFMTAYGLCLLQMSHQNDCELGCPEGLLLQRKRKHQSQVKIQRQQDDRIGLQFLCWEESGDNLQLRTVSNRSVLCPLPCLHTWAVWVRMSWLSSKPKSQRFTPCTDLWWSWSGTSWSGLWNPLHWKASQCMKCSTNSTIAFTPVRTSWLAMLPETSSTTNRTTASGRSSSGLLLHTSVLVWLAFSQTPAMSETGGWSLAEGCGGCDTNLQTSSSAQSLTSLLVRFPCLLPPGVSKETVLEQFRVYQQEDITVCMAEHIDNTWSAVGNLKDETGEQTMKELSKVMCGFLTVSHSSAHCERVFSCVRKKRTDQRSSLGDDTLESLLVLKSRPGSFGTRTSSKDVLDSVKSAYYKSLQPTQL